MSGEKAGERWSPVQRVESVLLSIISLLDDAECSSPANVDAGIMLRKDPVNFKQRVSSDVESSKQDIPAGFVMPTHESTVKIPIAIKDDDPAFWVDSDDEEEGFGGSDTDTEDAGSREEEEEDDDDDEMQEHESDEEGESEGRCFQSILFPLQNRGSILLQRLPDLGNTDSGMFNRS